MVVQLLIFPLVVIFCMRVCMFSPWGRSRRIFTNIQYSDLPNISDIGEVMPAQRQKDSKRQHPPQPQPTAIWQKIQKYPVGASFTSYEQLLLTVVYHVSLPYRIEEPLGEMGRHKVTGLWSDFHPGKCECLEKI